MSAVAAQTTQPVDRSRAKRRAAWRRRGIVLAFMSPWLVGFSVFFGYPLVMSAYLSFTHYDLLSPPRWVGLDNYRFMFETDQQVWPAVKNTLWFIAIAVPLQVLFALGIAIMLSRARRGVGVFRTVFYLPALAPPVAATLGFVYLLNPATGPVNTILGKVGIQGPLWFDSPEWSKPSLTLLAIWGVGNTMIIFLAAVIDVPKHLYESAELDGAGPLSRLRFVTLPTISPVILFAVVIGIEGCSTSPRPRRANVAGGSATYSAEQAKSSAIRGLDALLPGASTSRASATSTWATPRRWRCPAPAVRGDVLIVRHSRRFVHYQGGAVSTRRSGRGAARPAAAPVEVRRKASCSRSRTSLLIATAVIFIAVHLIADLADDSQQALSPKLWLDPFAGTTHRRLLEGARGITRSTPCSTRGSALGCSSRASRSPTRSRASVGGGPTSSS